MRTGKYCFTKKALQLVENATDWFLNNKYIQMSKNAFRPNSAAYTIHC